MIKVNFNLLQTVKLNSCDLQHQGKYSCQLTRIYENFMEWLFLMPGARAEGIFQELKTF